MDFYVVKGKFLGFYLVRIEHGHFTLYFRERPLSILKPMGMFKEEYFAVKSAEIYGVVNAEGKRAMRHHNTRNYHQRD